MELLNAKFNGIHFILTPFKGGRKPIFDMLSGVRHRTDPIYHIWKIQFGGPLISLRSIFTYSLNQYCQNSHIGLR